MTVSGIACKVCDSGALGSKRVHRMSGPAVAIGYILLIPSILGIAYCLLSILIIEAEPVHRYVPAKQVAISEMRENDIPEYVVQEVVHNPERDPTDYIGTVAMYQYSWIKDASEKIRRGGTVEVGDANATLVGQRLAEDLYLFLGIGAFVSGLLGWLLVMKKRVLQCSTCNAVVNAS